VSAALVLFALLAGPAPIDLEKELGAIRAGGEARKQAIDHIVKAGPDSFDALAERLTRKRTGTTAQFRLILDAIHADYPDDKGIFRAPTRQQREIAAKRGEPDWPALIEEQAPALIAANPGIEEAIAEALEAVALIRGIAAAKRWERYRAPPYPEDSAGPPPKAPPVKKGEPPAEPPKRPGSPTSVSVLIDFAFSEGGAVFRDECGRRIRALGNLAVPELIRYAFTLNRAGKAGGPMAGARQRYCLYQLDRLDRQLPARVMQTAPDDMIRGDDLRAYGETRATPAIKVVMGELDAVSSRVRKIARWAWLQYVTVKPPPTPKRKRKLGGGRESKHEEDLYLDYRTLANLELRRGWKDLTGTELEEEDKRPLRELTDALLRHYDDRREAVVVERLQAGHALRDKGDLEGAVKAYDEILAEDPLYARRSEMAPALVALASRSREAGDLRRAATLYRQVEAIAEGTPPGAQAAEARAVLEAKLHPPAQSPTLHVTPARRLALLGGLAALLVVLALMWRRAGRVGEATGSRSGRSA
jgi:hypothetical protein